MHSVTRNLSLSVASMAAVMSIALATPNIAGAAPPDQDPGSPSSTSTQTPPTTDLPPTTAGRADAPPTEQPPTTDTTTTAPSTSEAIPPTSQTPSSDTPAPSTSTQATQRPQARAAVAAGCQTYPPTSYQVCGVIRDKYNQMNGPNSFLLFPKSNELTNPNNTGKRSEFVGGNIYWSTATGAHPVAHDFLTKWGEKGYEGGYLKYPTTDEIPISGNLNGRRQEYQGGSIYFSQTTGAHTIQGAIKDKWVALGGQTGSLGYPIGDETVAPDGAGRYNRFEHGVIYWTASTGAHPVSGQILDRWADAGYETSIYGYPTGDPASVAGETGSTKQTFKNGSIYVRQDNYFRGIFYPASTYVVPSTAVLPHPSYDPKCSVDLSEYKSDEESPGPDGPGPRVKANSVRAAAVRSYFTAQGENKAGDLWDHFFGNSGDDYQLDASAIDQWATEMTTGYVNETPPTTPPGVTAAANRDQIVQYAIDAADLVNKPTGVIVSPGDWVLTGGATGDYVHSLGHHQLSSTTAVIANPGAAGQHQINFKQQIHICDVYDFDHFNAESGKAQYGSEVGHEATVLGSAKPFLVYGSGGVSSFSGLR